MTFKKQLAEALEQAVARVPELGQAGSETILEIIIENLPGPSTGTTRAALL